MKRFLGRIVCFGAVILLGFVSGCTTPPPAVSKTPSSSVRAAPATHRARAVLIFVPQTDDGAAAWMGWFDRHPNLRLVIAMSPRFTRFTKDTALKDKVLALERAGRLELALQLPNPPFLPLLIDTHSAKDAIPAGHSLPNPPYAYPDDVVQMVARAKADFFRQWNGLPRGLVLPHGAASRRLLALFDRLGFAWLAAALGAPPVDGPYQSGSVLIWDGTPVGRSLGTVVRVWDERDMKEDGKTASAPIESWAQEMDKDHLEAVLPSDAGIQTRPLPAETEWSRRTWTAPDWSRWIGGPSKNAAWEWLRRTRAELEAYQNSGRASVHRLDMAFEQFYTAENANFFAAIGHASPNLAEEREREFKAALATTYRLIGQAPPDDLFNALSDVAGGARPSSTTFQAESFPDGREHMIIRDAVGDSYGSGRWLDIHSLEIWTSNQSADWTVALSSPTEALVDIYIDLNGRPGAGTSGLLSGRKAAAAISDAWEYAICLAGVQAFLYRTQNGGGYGLEGIFPATRTEASVSVRIPREFMRGSPRRWSYQVLAMALDPGSPPAGVPQPLNAVPAESRLPPVHDLLDPLELSQAELLDRIETGGRSDIPFVRSRADR